MPDGELTVLTWNLWWRNGPWEERLAAITEVVRDLDPDVVALQEVWFADGTSSAHVVAEALGHHLVVGHRLVVDGVGFGNAELSRWPITGHEVVALPGVAGRDEQKLALFAAVDSPGGSLHVVSTHLSWRHDDSANRQEQVKVVCELVARTRPRDLPPVLCGDFNAVPDSDEIRMLTGKTTVPVDGLVFFDAWEATGAGRPPADRGDTWSDDNPYAAADLEQDRRIDYVFTGWRRPDGRGRPLWCRVVGDEPVGGVWPSDHFGVLAGLQR